jgi:hypothetical protein
MERYDGIVDKCTQEIIPLNNRNRRKAFSHKRRDRRRML